MKRVRVVCTGLLTLAWATAPTGSRGQEKPFAPAPDAIRQVCPAGGDIVPAAVRNTRVVAFGEFHGTKEIPQLVGDYVCALAQQEPRRPVVLALEFSAAEQPLADAYLTSPGGAADRDRLLAGYSWQTAPGKTGKLAGFQDGRTSQAGLALFERVRQLKAAGYPVAIVEFMETVNDPHDPADGPPDEDDSDRRHERAMAKILLKALAARPDARFVIEAGNAHAATLGDRAFPPRPRYRPMGQILRQAGVDIVSFDVTIGPDSHAWDCDFPEGYEGPFAMDKLTCGSHATPMYTPHPAPVVRLNSYDGTFYAGTTHASPPAVEATGKP